MAKNVVIDAGHGGEDPGAVGNGITEKDYTLKISEYIYDRLSDMGINSSMTRTRDTTLDPDTRTQIVQSFYGNGEDVIVLSNHINAGGGDGAEVIYALRNDSTLSDKIGEEFVKAGQNYRSSYQRRGTSDPSLDYYYMHRDTPNNETVIVEYGFLDSTGDDVSQIKNNWQSLAEAVVKATVEYAGGNYVPLEESNVYTVVSGDTLYSIARKFNTTVDELRRINELTSDFLTIGQMLYIVDRDSGSGVTPDSYIVKAGDSLYSIAKTFNTTVAELRRINNLTSDILSIGQVLLLKDNEVPEEPEPPVVPEEPDGNDITHTVKSGETLYSIAKLYNMSVDEIKALNNLTSNLLSIGQVLIIKKEDSDVTPEDDYIIYTVKSGDNLYSLARTYNTTVGDIKSLNNLTSDILSIGQVLKIPTKIGEVTTYTVVKGDSLYSIARKFNTSVNTLKSLNNLTSDILSIGQVLLIP